MSGPSVHYSDTGRDREVECEECGEFFLFVTYDQADAFIAEHKAKHEREDRA